MAGGTGRGRLATRRSRDVIRSRAGKHRPWGGERSGSGKEGERWRNGRQGQLRLPEEEGAEALFFLSLPPFRGKKGRPDFDSIISSCTAYFWLFRFVVPPSSPLSALLLHPSAQQHTSLTCNKCPVQPEAPHFLSRTFFTTTQAVHYGDTLEIALTGPRVLCSCKYTTKGKLLKLSASIPLCRWSVSVVR